MLGSSAFSTSKLLCRRSCSRGRPVGSRSFARSWSLQDLFVLTIVLLLLLGFLGGHCFLAFPLLKSIESILFEGFQAVSWFGCSSSISILTLGLLSFSMLWLIGQRQRYIWICISYRHCCWGAHICRASCRWPKVPWNIGASIAKVLVVLQIDIIACMSTSPLEQCLALLQKVGPHMVEHWSSQALCIVHATHATQVWCLGCASTLCWDNLLVRTCRFFNFFAAAPHKGMMPKYLCQFWALNLHRVIITISCLIMWSFQLQRAHRVRKQVVCSIWCSCSTRLKGLQEMLGQRVGYLLARQGSASLSFKKHQQGNSQFLCLFFDTSDSNHF